MPTFHFISKFLLGLPCRAQKVPNIKEFLRLGETADYKEIWLRGYVKCLFILTLGGQYSIKIKYLYTLECIAITDGRMVVCITHPIIQTDKIEEMENAFLEFIKARKKRINKTFPKIPVKIMNAYGLIRGNRFGLHRESLA